MRSLLQCLAHYSQSLRISRLIRLICPLLKQMITEVRTVKVSQTLQLICLHSPEGDCPKGTLEVNEAPLRFGRPDGKMATSRTSTRGWSRQKTKARPLELMTGEEILSPLLNAFWHSTKTLSLFTIKPLERSKAVFFFLCKPHESASVVLHGASV